MTSELLNSQTGIKYFRGKSAGGPELFGEKDDNDTNAAIMRGSLSLGLCRSVQDENNVLEI